MSVIPHLYAVPAVSLESKPASESSPASPSMELAEEDGEVLEVVVDSAAQHQVCGLSPYAAVFTLMRSVSMCELMQ